MLQRLTDSLTGRKYFIELLPLTLGEYAGIQMDDFFSFPESITQQGRLNEILRSLAVYGAYPEVVGKSTLIDLVLESNQTQEFWAFQITSGAKDSFSKAFDAYQPVKTFVVTPENAYRFCW